MAAHLGRWSWAAFRTGRLHQLQPTPGLAEIALWCSPILVDVARKLAMGAQLQTEQRSYNEQVTGVLSHYCDYLRPREFSVRLDVKMKRGVIGSYSLTWAMRAQAPADHGTADISTMHFMVLHPEEESQLRIDKEEYADLRWYAKEDVLTGHFHPVLKQAIRDLQVHWVLKRLEEAVDTEIEESEILALTREYVAAVKASDLTGKGAIRVDFDERTRTYAVACLHDE
ncbi:DSPTP1B [Symbiodinium pilosum]|uniref:DSPTP1B protein n=1 Tax=Symbiodinium pilosum TaxID=2952 RepID=A0A812TPB0_SYMPI|nr:DSPTP1B [Symbiodinium pilosum]